MLILKFLSNLMLPPMLQILLVLLGLLLWQFRRGLAMGCFVLSFLSLMLLSMPQVSRWLGEPLEIHPVIAPGAVEELMEGESRPQAIVVLGGGKLKSPEYGGETIYPDPLSRVRYGARLVSETGLPMLVAGGDMSGTGISEAELMADALADFGVDRVMMERLSQNTWENARYSAEILRRQGIDRIILVTISRHMRRSVYSFEQFGFEVTPAPIMVASGREITMPWVPNHWSLHGSALVIREWMGLLVYSVFYEPPANLDYDDDQNAEPEDGPPAQ